MEMGMNFFRLQTIITIVSITFLVSCADSVNLIAVLESESQSSNLQTFTYSIRVEELENQCDAINVTVTVITLISNTSSISPGSRITNTHSFGDISKRGSKTLTFTMNTDGKKVNIFGGASLAAVEGDPDCKFLGIL